MQVQCSGFASGRLRRPWQHEICRRGSPAMTTCHCWSGVRLNLTQHGKNPTVICVVRRRLGAFPTNFSGSDGNRNAQGETWRARRNPRILNSLRSTPFALCRWTRCRRRTAVIPELPWPWLRWPIFYSMNTFATIPATLIGLIATALSSPTVTLPCCSIPSFSSRASD